MLLDGAAAATFARCFDGAGELLLLVPVCIGAHLLAHAARLAARRGRRVIAAGGWILAVLLVAWVPLAALDLNRLTWALPVGHGGSVVASQLQAAWHIFSTQVAPVSTATGLVLAAAWTCGFMALAAEALDSDVTLPAIVSLVPAFDVVVFTGALGTASGRAIELAVLGAFAVWYLAGSLGRSRRVQVVVARVEETAAQRLARTRPGGLRMLRVAAPGLVLLGAIGAGVLGPLLPGAESQALVSWHGTAGSGANLGRPGGTGKGGTVVVSALVRVGEEEIFQAKSTLLTVHSSVATREVLYLLDNFNGNEWTPASDSSALQVALPPVGESTQSLLAHPPAVTYPGGRAAITEVLTVDSLGGRELPIPGPPLALSGVGNAVEASASGPVTVPTLRRGETFAIEAYLPASPPSSAGGQSSSSASGPIGGTEPLSADSSLPHPIPANIVALARRIVAGASTAEAKAVDIQDYLAGNPSFHYELPQRLPSGAIANSGEGYSALEAFLFHVRTGYCQQFASAFAVLARIDGLPTRIAVGLLPGTQTSRDTWQVSGSDVHAWPQVFIPNVGWSDYEPTPGTTPPETFNRGGPKDSTSPGAVHSKGSRPHNPRAEQLRPAPRSGSPLPSPVPRSASVKTPGPGLSPLALLWILLALAAIALLSVPVVRLAVLRRRSRSPSLAVVSSWRDALRVLAAAGFHRRRAETYNEFVHRVCLAGVLTPTGDAALLRLLSEVNVATFGRGPLGGEAAHEAAGDSRVVRRCVWRSIPRWRRLFNELDPRSVRAVL